MRDINAHYLIADWQTTRMLRAPFRYHVPGRVDVADTVSEAQDIAQRWKRENARAIVTISMRVKP